MSIKVVHYSSYFSHLCKYSFYFWLTLICIISCLFQPWIQRRKIDFAKHKHVISRVLKHLKIRALGRLLNDQGEPSREVIKMLFTAMDTDHDKFLSSSELRALIVGIRFEEINLDEENATSKVLNYFDSSLDEKVDLEEFIRGIKNWIDEAMCLKGSPQESAGGETIKHLTRYHEQTKREHFLLEDQSDEFIEGVKNPQRTTMKAVLLLLLGAIIAAAFVDPLVDVVDNFSSVTCIPSFFISFIALPFATNSSEAMSAVIFASKKKLRSASLTFSEV